MAKKPKILGAALAFRGSLSRLNKSRITRLIMHHMAHQSWDIYDVHNYHKGGNGWSGVGYNWWISFDGKIYEGRGSNQGAHASGYNTTSLGIGYQGDFTKQKMPDAQLQAGIELNNWLMAELGLSKNAIVGHRDVGNTTCPGPNFRMSELKGGKPQPASKSKPAASNPKGANLSVDGKWGPVTTRALQRSLNTVVDGVISSQPKNSATQALYGGVTWGSKGSLVIRTLQNKVGSTVDGKLGPNTVRATQKHLGTPQDGVISRPSSAMVKELQRRLNAGTF